KINQINNNNQGLINRNNNLQTQIQELQNRLNNNEMAGIAQKGTNEYNVQREINEYNNPRVELGTLLEFDGRQNTVEGFIKQIQQIFDTYPDLPQGNEQYVRADGSAVTFDANGTVTNRLNNEAAPGTNWQVLKLKRR